MSVAATGIVDAATADESCGSHRPRRRNPADRAAPPPLPARTGFYTPTRFEGDVFDCEVVGKIPADLNGAFVRVGEVGLSAEVRG